MNAITAAPHSVARPLMLRFLLQVIVQITREPWVHAMHANEDEPQQEIRTNRINDEMEFNPVHPACSFRRTQHPMRRILPGPALRQSVFQWNPGKASHFRAGPGSI